MNFEEMVRYAKEKHCIVSHLCRPTTPTPRPHADKHEIWVSQISKSGASASEGKEGWGATFEEAVEMAWPRVKKRVDKWAEKRY